MEDRRENGGDPVSQTITQKFLRSKGACREQLDILFAEFPNGGEVTLENCLRAAVLSIDFNWAANRLLSAPAEKAYREARAPAWKAYQEATALAFYNAWLIDHPIGDKNLEVTGK